MSARVRTRLLVALVPLAAGGGFFLANRGNDDGSTAARVEASTTTTNLRPPVTAGYLAMGVDPQKGEYAWFLQWRNDHGALTGTYQTVQLRTYRKVGRDGSFMKTETTTGSMTGSLDGSAISVSFNSSPLFFGRVDGDGFQVDVPQDSGGTAPLVLHRATTSAFNSEVTRLQSVADDANARENATEDRAWEQEPLCAKGDPFYLDCTWPDGRKETCNTLASGECPYPRREPGELPPSQRSR